MIHTEEELREVAWDIIGRLSVARLLEDCVEALVEAYQMDEELYITDKELLEEDDAVELSMPMRTYINTAAEQKEEEEPYVSVTE